MLELLVGIGIFLIWFFGALKAHQMIRVRWGASVDRSTSEASDMVYVYFWFSWLTVLWIKFLLDPVWLQAHESVARA